MIKIFYFSFLIITLTISIISGSTIAKALDNSITQNVNNIELGKQLYIENCSSCHIPIPAEVLPTTSWQQILNNPTNHYGQRLPEINRITTSLLWNYLGTNSRLLLVGENTPQYVTNSRYFKALHPQVNLPKPSSHQTCISCHPGAKQLDYRNVKE